MRLFALLIVGLIATAPTAMASPSDYVDKEIWRAVTEGSAIDQFDEFVRGELRQIERDPIDYAAEADEDYYAEQGSRTACWSAHHASPKAYETAKDTQKDVGAHCDASMGEGDRDHSLDQDEMTAAAGKDIQDISLAISKTVSAVLKLLGLQ